jgi:oligopeptide transport system permease protein
MFQYILKRIIGTIPTLFIMISLSFFMIRLAPGGPFDQEKPIPKEIQENLKRKYNLDEPLPKQFVRYLCSVLKGDLGPSFQYRDFTVVELIKTSAPVSFKVGSVALLIALLMGVILGCAAAIHQNGWMDHALMSISLIGITLPTFVIAPLLTLFLGVYLRVLPVAGWYEGDLSHMVLPVVTLALPQMAYIARLTRGSMIEVLNSNYIRMAQAKGLGSCLVVWRHALRPALLPVLSYLGPAATNILTGSVVIEQIFGIPGLGRYFVHGALNRDYTLVMGMVIFYGVLIILCNLIVDLLYGVLDPRIRQNTNHDF